MLATVEDVSEIASNLNDIFHHTSHARAQEIEAENKKPPTLIDTLLKRSQETEKVEADGSDTLSDSIKITVSKREHEEALADLRYAINQKWPTPHDQPSTFDQILRTQANLRKKKILQRREAEKQRLADEAAEKEHWKKVGMECLKLGVLIIIGGAIVLGLIHAYNSGPIR